MKNLKSFLVVLSVLVFLSAQSSTESLSEKTDMELIQMLEQELNKRETLVNQQKEQLNNLREQLNEQIELNETLNKQINNLLIQSTLANESYQNLKKDNLKNKIKIGLLFGFGGFFGGYVARNRMSAIQE